VNDSPTAIDDSANVNEDSSKLFADHQGILKNDSDVDGDKLYIKTVQASTGDEALGIELESKWGSIIVNADGSYRFTADNADKLDAGDRETDTFTYTLTDLANEDSATIEIQITGVNDAPSLSSITKGSVTDQANSDLITTTNLSGQLTASDPDESAVLEYGISSVNTTRISNNSINSLSSNSANGAYGQLSVNSTTGAYSYTPNNTSINSLAAGQTVTESFTLFATDGSLTSTKVFDITIKGATDTASSTGSDSSGSSSSSSSSSNSTSSSSSGGTSSSSTKTNSSQSSDVYIDTLIGALINNQNSTSNDFSSFLTTADSFLVASNDLSLFKYQSTDLDLFNAEEGGGGITQLITSNRLSTMDLSNGIRVMLPNLCITDWQDHVPNHRDGEIPIFISLLEQPDEAATVLLETINLPVSLSSNSLHFTPENWDQSQIVWANLNDIDSGEAISTLKMAASLRIGSTSAQPQVEIFSISLPDDTEPALGGCTTEPDNTSQSDSDTPNIDLELSTVKEEESPAFLLLRTALSPIILLANMAMHSIQQIQGNQRNQPNQTEADKQPSNKNSLITTLPQESSQIDFNFDGLQLTSQSINHDIHLVEVPTASMTPSVSSLSGALPDNTVDLW
jgi:VCBS repeat-containing protein